jgi:hypothetical protein
VPEAFHFNFHYAEIDLQHKRKPAKLPSWFDSVCTGEGEEQTIRFVTPPLFLQKL